LEKRNISSIYIYLEVPEERDQSVIVGMGKGFGNGEGMKSRNGD